MFLLALMAALSLGQGSAAWASTPPWIPTNSYDAHIRNLLLAGKVSEALSYAQEHYGKVPVFLQRYAAAFDAAHRAVGRCQDVARALHGGLSQLGTKAEYVAIRSKWDNITLDLPNGKNQVLSYNGYHVVVRVEGMVYDAYTGASGMKFTEYLSRLQVPAGHTLQTTVVSNP